jgi:phage I-like protein
MTNLPILNRDFKKPADGWYHIAPKGEFKHPQTGLLQVIDDPALDAIVNRFEADKQSPNFPGTRIDFDHFSYDLSKASEAAGWIKEMTKRDDGLWAQVRWSDLGDQAITNGSYRLISPAWMPQDLTPLGKNVARPMRLDSAGLTNNPVLRGMVPLTNRQGEQPPVVPPTPEPQKPQKDKRMKSVANLLGLQPDASEEAVFAGAKAVLNRAEKAESALEATKATHAAELKTTLDSTVPIKNRAGELESNITALNATITEQKRVISDLTTIVVESDLNAHAEKFKPEARDNWKTQLILNRSGTLSLLESITPIPAPVANGQPVLNRADGQTPHPNSGTFPDLVAKCMASDGCSKAEATKKMMTDHPDALKRWRDSGGGTL